MALKILPVRSDIAAYTFIISLDGVLFQLGFKFNSRMNMWLMDVYNSDGIAIVVGRPLFSQIDPLRYFVQKTLPEGVIGPLNLNENFVDATEDNFGSFVKLFYVEAGT